MAVYHVALVGVVLYVVRGMWQKLFGNQQPFVTLYTSRNPEHTPLPKNGKACMDSSRLSLVQLIRTNVPALGPEATFDGIWWLPGGDAQTVYSAVADFSQVDPIVYERRLLQVSDGGIIAVDVSPPPTSVPITEGENILLVAHGLTGGSHEAYVRAVLSRVTFRTDARGRGFRAIVMNYRGCNGSPVVTPRLYHAGSSDDVRPVVLWIAHMFPECRMYGLGFSLGANILTKYAGEEGDKCPLRGLVTLANPWDFVKGCHHLPSTFLGRHVYRYVLGEALRRLMRLHRNVFMDAVGIPLSRASLQEFFERPRLTLREYDELITAPMYGYKDALDHYAKISSSNVVRDIRVPCLAINSLDDPFTGERGLPIREIRASDNPLVVLAVTRAGGHLGWYERGPGGRTARWYVKPVEQFLAALVEYDLEAREPPRAIGDETGFVRQVGRDDDVGFRELSQEEVEFVVSGAHVSKLFSGW
ncbi:AB-hydrolase YheT [Trametes meyenii]|nr:AB-hydrolase YheT [Trametes meyenii]